MQEIIREIEKVIKGKEDKIKVILATFFAGGHILLEDIPGVGKTTIAKTIAKVLGLEFNRVQFTSDLLPSDILGVNYFDIELKKFVFKKGPIFTEIFLADEINRASPKTQSALLEAMEERQISIDGNRFSLSEDFFVIATQNPLEDVGTFPLPISQIDRFMVSLSIGYPDRESEKMILKRDSIPLLNNFKSKIKEYKKKAKEIYVDDKIIEIILNILNFTRSNLFEYGLSTRAGISIVDMAKSWALINEREYVIDEDVVEILPYVATHRLIPKNKTINIIDEIIRAVF
ncbi:AAA family ATPase [Caminibacter mediatlanticus]|uniref:Succinyl-CoA ligase, alpha subunit n=1 Tax=Caminibacter mediatlanticus TB-2 TaxID=391592 RepID=A0AAI9F2Y8_9BACT|nr:AAA family ATPase [Caminibacter mediatlanticus]EDM24304.1 Succinyl-CoA ligase, alpha subunit [Caminibacter mediatlanticus TB-2]